MANDVTKQPATRLTPAQKRRRARQAQAALLLGTTWLSDEKIAAQVGIDRRTLTRWKLQPAFAAEKDAHFQKELDKITERGRRGREARLASCRSGVPAWLR